MNSKIFKLLIENLEETLNLPKYEKTTSNLNEQTTFEEIGITPVKFEKFQEDILETMSLKSVNIRWEGTIEDVVDQLDVKYSTMFFGEIWKPQTDDYSYTGWALVDEVKKLNPRAVLDVGCGYNQFKERIPNLIGIDPYNNIFPPLFSSLTQFASLSLISSLLLKLIEPKAMIASKCSSTFAYSKMST